MIIDLGQNEYNLYLGRSILNIGESTSIELYLTSQLSENKLSTIEGILTQHQHWVELSLNIGDAFENQNVAGFYILNFKYEVEGEFVDFDELFLIKAKNSTFNDDDSAFSYDIKYKTFNG